MLKPKKSSKNDYSFCNTVSLKKTYLILRTLTHLILQKRFSSNIAKNLYKISSKNVSGWRQKKSFAMDHFLTPKNCILEALGKQMSFYSCKYPLFSEKWDGGLNNLLKTSCCLGLVKCFKIFHFNQNFWKHNYFSAFYTSINSNETPTFSIQFGLQS